MNHLPLAYETSELPLLYSAVIMVVSVRIELTLLAYQASVLTVRRRDQGIPIRYERIDLIGGVLRAIQSDMRAQMINLC